MSSSRIYHNITRLPLGQTVILIWANYEIYRIHKGTHPFWSPKLRAAGFSRATTDASSSAAAENKTRALQDGGVSALSITWHNLNGLPIPTLEALLGPAGKE